MPENTYTENLVPTHCPSCNKPLEWSYSGTDLICSNPLCPAQILYYLAHFCKVMGVEEMSSTTIEKFSVDDVQSLYNLTESYISSIPGFADKKATIIVEQLKNSLKDVLPAKLIEAFGIPGLGSKNAENLVRFFKCNPEEALEKFFSIDSQTLMCIDGFGPRIISKIMEMREACRELYEFLVEKGLTFKQTTLASTKLQGLRICMTGASPDKRSRQVLSKILESHGAEVQGSVNKKTDILIAENVNGNSSKLKKARDSGVKVVTYEDFFKNL